MGEVDGGVCVTRGRTDAAAAAVTLALTLTLAVTLSDTGEKGTVLSRGVMGSVLCRGCLIFTYFLFLAARGFPCRGQALAYLRRAGAPLRCGARRLSAGPSRRGARALGVRASGVAVRGRRSCGPRASWPRGRWDLPEPGVEAVFPASAGRFPSTVPPGKSCLVL